MSPELSQAFSDLVFSVKFKKKRKKAFLYVLLEHKSYPDKWYKFQIHRYMALIWDAYRRNTPKLKLPPIIPTVLYHGKTAWKETSIADLFDNDHLEVFKPFTPEFKTVLCDVRNIPKTTDKNIELFVFLNTLAAVMRSELEAHFFTFLETLVQKLEPGKRTQEVIATFTRYFFKSTPKITEDKLEKALTKIDQQENTHYKEGAMSSFAKKWSAHGKKEGIEEGILLGVEKGILLGEQKGFLLGEQKARQEARQEARRKDYETMLRLHSLKSPLETIALAVNLPATSVKAILKEGFKAMEKMYLEENADDLD